MTTMTSTCKLVLSLLLLFSPVQALFGQACTPIPVPGTTITQSTLDELRKRGAIASGVSAFASLEAFAMAFGGSLPYVPRGAITTKFWADFTNPPKYVIVNGWLDTASSSTWSDFSMKVYGPTVARFYQDRAKARDPIFARIPRFVEYTTLDAGVMDMSDGIGKPGPRTVTATEAPYPLAREMDDPVGDGGKQWSWPRNHILRFAPQTGQVEACDYQWYGQTYPIITTVSVGQSGPGTIKVRGMSDEQFLQLVGAAIFGGGTPAERVAKILNNLEVN